MVLVRVGVLPTSLRENRAFLPFSFTCFEGMYEGEIFIMPL